MDGHDLLRECRQTLAEAGPHAEGLRKAGYVFMAAYQFSHRWPDGLRSTAAQLKRTLTAEGTVAQTISTLDEARIGAIYGEFQAFCDQFAQHPEADAGIASSDDRVKYGDISLLKPSTSELPTLS